MKRSTLFMIIGLMSISLVGLISFQLYWISNAFQINEERFRQDVHEVLNDVARKLEKQEVAFIAAKKLPQVRVFQQNSTSFRFSSRPGSFDSLSRLQSFPEFSGRFQNSFDQLDQMLSQSPFQQMFREEVRKARSFTQQIDSINRINQIYNLERLSQKSEMVTIVLNELISSEKEIGHRIDSSQVDSLLYHSLVNKGIDIDFNYGIINQEKDDFIFMRSDEDKKKLMQSGFSVNLFPNDIRGSQNYLVIQFPDQRQFLINKIWLAFSLSVIFLIIVICCFAYAIFTIIRQKKLSDVKNDFINNMTHEFKTPISTVSLACEALLDQDIPAGSNFVQRYLSIIKDENQRLGSQVEKVLQMATLEKKDFKLNLEQVDVHQIITKALKNIDLQVNKRGGAINKHLAADHSNLIADRVHLTNIIYNLLDNANKYSSQSPEILIETFNQANNLVVRVSDKGIGMSKEALKKIFDKFYRVPTGNVHDVKGFGLGLTYVKTMVEAQGGEIKVSSTPKKGSTFEIYLPLNHGKI
ncbi:MAG: sensor histidine kinase [Candidatus Cyclobacteriaceae bacterium M3_2C_046]